MFRTRPSPPCPRPLLALAVLAAGIPPAVAQGVIVPVRTGAPPAPAGGDVQADLPRPQAAGRVRAEPEAVVELRALGAKITCDEKDPARPIVKVNLYGASIKDADLAHLASLTTLRELNLFGCTRLTDKALEHLAGLKGLRVLSLGRTQVGDAGLKRLTGLTGLQELDLSDTQVRGSGLVHLRALTGLRRLDLGGTDLAAGGLEHLTGLDRLEEVSLYFSKAGNAGLAHLKGLPRLRDLNVRGTQVSEAGIRALRAALPRVEVVR
jgi:hypothetical protein